MPEEQIHNVDQDLPELETTRAWRHARVCAEALVSENLPDYPPERIERVMRAIEQAGRSDGITHDREVLTAWMHASIPRMHEAMHAGDLSGFMRPACDVVRSYLAFELPGMLACELLAFLLSVQCDIPRLGPPNFTPPEARARAIDHLADLTFRLRERRAGKRATPYFELTYLLVLYGGACAVLAGHARDMGADSTAEGQRTAKIAMHAEEIAAHDAVPAFVLPAMFEPSAIVTWLCHRAGGSEAEARGLADYYCLYPVLEPFVHSTSGEDANRAFEASARTHDPDDVQAALDSDLHPVTKDNRETIMLGLLAMQFGRAMT